MYKEGKIEGVGLWYDTGRKKPRGVMVRKKTFLNVTGAGPWEEFKKVLLLSTYFKKLSSINNQIITLFKSQTYVVMIQLF